MYRTEDSASHRGGAGQGSPEGWSRTGRDRDMMGRLLLHHPRQQYPPRLFSPLATGEIKEIKEIKETVTRKQMSDYKQEQNREENYNRTEAGEWACAVL